MHISVVKKLLPQQNIKDNWSKSYFWACECNKWFWSCLKAGFQVVFCLVLEIEILKIFDLIGKNGSKKGICRIQKHNFDELGKRIRNRYLFFSGWIIITLVLIDINIAIYHNFYCILSYSYTMASNIITFEQRVFIF